MTSSFFMRSIKGHILLRNKIVHVPSSSRRCPSAIRQRVEVKKEMQQDSKCSQVLLPHRNAVQLPDGNLHGCLIMDFVGSLPLTKNRLALISRYQVHFLTMVVNTVVQTNLDYSVYFKAERI
ncbi:uncharacterized [Tachysurus ichikawai]